MVRTEVVGVARSVLLRAADDSLAFEAELDDGVAAVRLVWLGRRRVAGITPGRRLRAWGRVAHEADGPVMYNPRYELGPRDED